MGNPIRINLPGEAIKTILEAPGAKVNAHLVVTKDGDGVIPSELEWKEPGTINERNNVDLREQINENLLPQLSEEDDGKILIAQNGHWVAIDFSEAIKNIEEIMLSVKEIKELSSQD